MEVTRNLVVMAMLGALGGGAVWAQPTAPTTADATCLSSEPSEPGAADTVVSTPDAQGFFSLFNGTDFTGWWLSGLTSHGSCPAAIFRVDPAQKAIYSTQRGTSTGGILMTRKKFSNYEIVFDYWPDFNNDGGIFHRTPGNGRCFQTVLDYINSGSLGGTWGEGQPSPIGSRDLRPFSYSGNENTISINTNPQYGWTVFTGKDPDRATYGCNNGCGAADYTRLWDVDGWNQIRMVFYGGLTQQTLPVRMKSWFRKSGVTNYWVPVISDTTVNTVLGPNYIGLQVHNGGRFSGPKGTWYRNIKWRPLDNNGNPVTVTRTTTPEGKILNDIVATAWALTGTLASKHEIVLFDATGKTVERFSGPAGHFSYDFKSNSRGMLSMRIKTDKGVEFRKVHRDFLPD